MSSAKQNRHIAKLIVGAMAIDGSLSKEEQKKVAVTLDKLGMSELIADVGAAIDEDQGDFNMFQECKDLVQSLGADAFDTAPVVFRMIADVIASDRFVSAQEASYLSALGKRLDLAPELARKVLRQVMADRRGRLEVSASAIDETIHPHLKALLSFPGAEELVGELSEDSLEEMMVQAQEAMAEGCDVTLDDVERSLTVLGLNRGSTTEEAEQVWRETIDGLNLPKMANLGETFVTAALNRITRINDAYKTILHFQEHLDKTKKAKVEAERLQKEVQRAKAPSTRNNLADKLEKDLTGVGVVKPDEDKE
jgi:hypothetical protein